MNFYARITNKSRSNVPFVPIPSKTLLGLDEYISINEHTVLYDLGSGNGKIVCYLYKKNKKGTYVGIERGLFPYLLSLWKGRNIPKSKVKFLLNDINNVDLSSATDITMYLFPEFLDELLPKLVRELRPGSRAYSVDFKFSSKEPTKVVALDNHSDVHGRRLYVYEF